MREGLMTIDKQPRPAARIWTIEEEARLREMARRGVSKAEIARQLGRTELSVGARLTLLNSVTPNVLRPMVD